MARDPARREALAERATDWALEHGLIGLSLRPLAAAIGTSDRMLLYHFADRDDLVATVLRVSTDRAVREVRALPVAAGVARWVIEFWEASIGCGIDGSATRPRTGPRAPGPGAGCARPRRCARGARPLGMRPGIPNAGNRKPPVASSGGFQLAEDGGFEPPRVLSQHDFQSCALGHYANPPRARLPEGARRTEIRASELLLIALRKRPAHRADRRQAGRP